MGSISYEQQLAILHRSFAHCHRITRRRARNFYYGLKLTPEPRRSAMYAVYAFMRACDDLVDGAPSAREASGDEDRSEEGEHLATAVQRVEAFRDTMCRALAAPHEGALPDGRIWPAFRHVTLRYEIDPAHFHAMLDGQAQDLTQTRYETFEELADYCRKVASTVGLVCLSVWGHDNDPQARTLAEYRGIAFQLTNILRDLREDAQADRVYLPSRELERFGYRFEDLLQGNANAAFDRLMMYQIERARNYYEMSAPLERHIVPECRATSSAMTGIYRGLLERIARDPRRVLSTRVRLGAWRNMGIAVRAVWRHRRGEPVRRAADPQPPGDASVTGSAPR